MTIYGLHGFTHHGGRVLTVMSDAGRTEALEQISESAGLRVQAAPGRLTQYHEISAGSLATLVNQYNIEVVPRERWLAVKAELGDRIYQ